MLEIPHRSPQHQKNLGLTTARDQLLDSEASIFGDGPKDEMVRAHLIMPKFKEVKFQSVYKNMSSYLFYFRSIIKELSNIQRQRTLSEEV